MPAAVSSYFSASGKSKRFSRPASCKQHPLIINSQFAGIQKNSTRAWAHIWLTFCTASSFRPAETLRLFLSSNWLPSEFDITCTCAGVRFLCLARVLARYFFDPYRKGGFKDAWLGLRDCIPSLALDPLVRLGHHRVLTIICAFRGHSDFVGTAVPPCIGFASSLRKKTAMC